MKTKKRLVIGEIVISIIFLLIAAFLFAGPYLAPETFKNSPPEKYNKYKIVTDCFFYTGLFGLIDGIWRRYRINKERDKTPQQDQTL